MGRQQPIGWIPPSSCSPGAAGPWLAPSGFKVAADVAPGIQASPRKLLHGQKASPQHPMNLWAVTSPVLGLRAGSFLQRPTLASG